MAEAGLRELKKAATRRHIAETAARLFAEHGYEKVSVNDVARSAAVAEQTVYNYFPTKEQLVTDLDRQIQDRLCDLVRSRPAGTSPASAVRSYVIASVEAIERIPADMWRGELGYLAAMSPSVHRLSLELTDRQARALSEAIAETSDLSAPAARLHGIALAGVFQAIISDSGHRTRRGDDQAAIAKALREVVVEMLDEMDRWFVFGQLDRAGRRRAR